MSAQHDQPGSRPYEGGGSLGRWATELVLGLRLSVTGGRDSLVRTLLTALGVGGGVALLLLASSFPAMRGHRDDRLHAIADMMFAQPDTPRSDHSVLMTDVSTRYHGSDVRGRAVQPEGAAAALPLGLTRYPAPGTMIVSPALADLLRSPDGALLKERLDYPVSGQIGESGLVGPGDYAFYLGGDQLASVSTAVRLDHFGGRYPAKPLDPLLVLLTVAGVVILLTPVAVFIAAAVRFGGDARDRRLAALRLVGADRATTARVAAGESLAGAILGLAAGAVFFLIGGQLIELITVQGLSVFARDLEPSPLLAVPALAAVPVLAVAVTLLTMRRIAVEPLGVVRGARTRKRVLWWRLALPLAGVVVLTSQRSRLENLNDNEGIAALVVGLLLLLIGATLLLPSLLDFATRGLGDGPPSWQLAVRRIQFGIEAAVRPTAGIVVAVAGAIALQTLLGAVVTERNRPLAMAGPHGSELVATFVGADGTRAAQYAALFQASPGVAEATGYTQLTVTGTDPNLRTWVVVGDCAALRTFGAVTDCADGDVFTARTQAIAGEPPGMAEAGQTVTVQTWRGADPQWHIPAARAVVGPAPDPENRLAHTVLLVTPGAIPADLMRGVNTTVRLRPAQSTPDYVERIRNTAARIDIQARVYNPYEPVGDQTFTGIRRALTAGVAVVLTLIGASMLVSLMEQLRDRKRALAVLTAFGTRRRTLAWSVLWQSALPVALGLLLAVAAGVGLSTVLLDLAHLPTAFAWGEILTMAGLGGAAVLLVTVLSLPMIWRHSRAGGLRHE